MSFMFADYVGREEEWVGARQLDPYLPPLSDTRLAKYDPHSLACHVFVRPWDCKILGQ